MTPQKLRRPRAVFLDTNTVTPGAPAPAFLAKNLLAAAMMALCASMVSSPAANADTADRDSPSHKWYLDAGLLIHASGDVTGVGANLRVGRYIGESNRITLDIGGCFDVDPKVTGHFNYTYSGSSTVHHDGKIQINHTLVPVLLGWEHEWKTKNERWAFRIGPVAGAAFVSGKEERRPHVSNASNVFRNDSGTAFLGGINAGLRWNCVAGSDRWHVDFSLAALGATGVKLDKFSEDINLSGGRFVLSVGLRF